METQIPQAVTDLLNEIPIFQQNHTEEIEQLKNDLNLTKEEEINRLTLCLILEKEIEEKGTIKKLNLITEHQKFFKSLINQTCLANILYELVRHAALKKQTKCTQELCQKYADLFESSIFSQNAKLNFESLEELITSNSVEAIKILTNQGILDFTSKKSELRKLALQHKLDDIEKILASSIRKDRKKMCQHLAIITLSLSLLLTYYLLS